MINFYVQCWSILEKCFRSPSRPPLGYPQVSSVYRFFTPYPCGILRPPLGRVYCTTKYDLYSHSVGPKIEDYQTIATRRVALAAKCACPRMTTTCVCVCAYELHSATRSTAQPLHTRPGSCQYPLEGCGPPCRCPSTSLFSRVSSGSDGVGTAALLRVGYHDFLVDVMN